MPGSSVWEDGVCLTCPVSGQCRARGRDGSRPGPAHGCSLTPARLRSRPSGCGVGAQRVYSWPSREGFPALTQIHTSFVTSRRGRERGSTRGHLEVTAMGLDLPQEAPSVTVAFGVQTGAADTWRGVFTLFRVLCGLFPPDVFQLQQAVHLQDHREQGPGVLPGAQQQGVRELQGGRRGGVRPRHHVPEQRHLLQQRLHAEEGRAVQVGTGHGAGAGKTTRTDTKFSG